jgi:tetratricopeptide (TPR) repeat protein
MPDDETDPGRAAALQAVREASAREDTPAWRELCEAAAAQYPDSPDAWALCATARKWHAQVEEAHAALERARDLAPEAPIVVALAANMAAFEGRAEEALEAADRALASGTDDYWALQWCTGIYFINGAHEKALELTERAYRIYPDDPEALYQLTLALGAAGRKDEAEARIAEGERMYPEQSRFARTRARKLMATGKLSEAATLLRECVKRTPNSFATWADLANVLSFARRGKEAEAAARKALAISPCAATAMLAMARVCRQRGQEEEAKAWQDRLYATLPFLKWSAVLGEANAAIRKEDWAGAAEAAHRALAAPSRTTRGVALGLEARALVELNRPVEADADLDEMERLGDDGPSLYELRGRAALLQGDAARGTEVLRDGLRHYPSAGQIRAHLLRAVHGQGAQAEADALAQEALESPPDTPWGMSGLVMALMDTDHDGEARQMIQTGLERFPGADELRLFEGLSKLQKGDVAGAQAVADGIGGQFGEVAQQLGQAAARMGAMKAAAGRRDWAKVVEIADQQLAETDPRMRDASLRLKATALFRLERYDEAEDVATELDRADPPSETPYHVRAKVRLGRNDPNGAIGVLRGGLARFPGSGSLRRALLRVLHSQQAQDAEAALVADILANPPEEARELATLYVALLDAEHPAAANDLRAIAERSSPDACGAALYFQAFDLVAKGKLSAARQKLQGVAGEWRELANSIDSEIASLDDTLQSIAFWSGHKPTPGEPKLAAESVAHHGRMSAWRFWEKKR